MSRRAPFVSMLLALACAADGSFEGPRSSASELRLGPKARRLVSFIAGGNTLDEWMPVEDAQHYPGYQDFLDLEPMLTETDAVALLGHPSPAMRGYAAKHIVHARPHLAQEVLPLLEDPAMVHQGGFCGMPDVPLGRYLRAWLARVVEESALVRRPPPAGHAAARVLLESAGGVWRARQGRAVARDIGS